MSNSNRTGNISHVHNWEAKVYDEQMWSWLHFALNNRNNVDYKTPQTQRWGETGRTRPHTISSPKYMKMHEKRTWTHTKRAERNQINTAELFKDWHSAYKAEYRKRRPDMLSHKMYVHYPEAVVEMHAFFDFIDDSEA